MQLTRPLIAFAFLAERFEQTGDIAQGLIALFAPIIDLRRGQAFSASEFAANLSEYYGIGVHPWVVEDWLGRLESEKYVEKVYSTAHLYAYRYVESPRTADVVAEDDVKKLLDLFCAHADSKLRTHGIEIGRDQIEQAFVSRLVRPEFLNIILKPDRTNNHSSSSPTTLRLPRTELADEGTDQQRAEAHFDFLCAEFILAAYHGDAQLFAVLTQITCGALVAEVILDFQAPTQKIDLKNVTIYLDSPFVMDLLDLSYEENVKYSKELFKQLKDTGARLAIFPHSIEEIRGAIKAPLDRFDRGETVTGPTGSRLRSSAFRAYARSVAGQIEKEIKELGVAMAGTSTLKSPQALQAFTQTQEDELATHIGHYENVSAKLRDAGSIANVIRLRLGADIPMHNLSACRAFFLTRNSRLSNLSTNHLVKSGLITERSVPPCISDRYMAGLLWILRGGKGKEISRQRLLANCAAAVSPRQDVIKRVHTFLSDLDEEKARHFEALMTNNKAAHYLMGRALGDARFISKDDVPALYEEVERIAAEKVAQEKDGEIRQIRAEYERAFAEREAADELVRADALKAQEAGRQVVKQISEEAFQAREEALKAQDMARREKDRAERIAEQLEELRGDSERSTMSAVQHALNAGKRAEHRAQLCIAVGIALATIFLGLAAAYVPDWFGKDTVAAKAIVIASVTIAGGLAFIQFWVFPERFFGAFVMRRRDEAFFRKARELNIADRLDGYTIDWLKRTVTKK